MDNNQFRTLRADEIECRVGRCNKNGVSLLLYKDARCDMAILDETVGPMNWRREHSRDNRNCTVSIWDEEKEQWISKEDTGTESNTEAEKGLASDSFKRACVNWGIGRELYTAPFIWIPEGKCDVEQGRNGNWKCKTSFRVTRIGYDERRLINELEIAEVRNGNVVYRFSNSRGPAQQTAAPAQPQSNLPENPIICAGCKQIIKPARSGQKLYSPEEIANGALKTYGKPLCWDCMTKRKKAKAQQGEPKVSAGQVEWIKGAYEILWGDGWLEQFRRDTNCAEPSMLPASEYERLQAYLNEQMEASQMPMTGNG